MSDWQVVNPVAKPVQPYDPAILYPSLEHGGIRIDVCEYSWRCSECMKMQPGGTAFAWVECGIHIGCPWPQVVEVQRAHAWNGDSSAWCIDCAEKLLPPKELPEKASKRLKKEWREYVERMRSWFR